MKLNKLHCESVAHFSEQTQRMLLTENPRGFLEKPVPAELAFLQGDLLDLCFENMGLSDSEQWSLYKSLDKTGILIPNTKYRVRLTPSSMLAIELADGAETTTLPVDWKQAIYVLNATGEYVWIGKRVRKDQTGTFDRTTLNEYEDGFGL